MKGILFKPDIIKAIRDKRKTVTRRRIDIDPLQWILQGMPYGMAQFDHKETNERVSFRPRYQVGDTVYIKEAHAEWQGTSECVRNGDLTITEALEYIVYKDGAKDWQGIREDAKKGHPWDIRSPLFMPAWAARYFIKPLNVTAELLKLPLSPDELEKEGGEIALPMLEKINGKWVFRYEFESTKE